MLWRHDEECHLVFQIKVDDMMYFFPKKLDLGHKGGVIMANVLATTQVALMFDDYETWCGVDTNLLNHVALLDYLTFSFQVFVLKRKSHLPSFGAIWPHEGAKIAKTLNVYETSFALVQVQIPTTHGNC